LGRICFIILCLIIYGSLYPWQFHAVPFATVSVSVFLHSWPASLHRFVVRDTIVNVILYAPLGIFGYLWSAQYFRKSAAMAVVMAFSVVLSTGVELAQLFEPSRYSSAFDVVCNLTGALAGAAVARVYSQSLVPLVSWGDRISLRPFSSATILLLCWIAYQTIPLFPQLSTTQLIVKIRSLGGAASWSLVEMSAGIVDWLAVAAVVDEVVEPAGSRFVLTALMLLLPVRLLLDTRSVTGAECVGASLALMIRSRFLSKPGKRFSLLTSLSVAALVSRGLAPFQFTAHGQFSWVPFAASLSYEQAAAFVVFFRKCFLYGVAVWLAGKAGCRYIAGALGIAAILAAIEAAQLRLPGRTPEITDPLLALIMAGILYLTDRHKKTVDETAA
jgi:VanZ family protein